MPVGHLAFLFPSYFFSTSCGDCISIVPLARHFHLDTREPGHGLLSIREKCSPQAKIAGCARLRGRICLLRLRDTPANANVRADFSQRKGKIAKFPDSMSESRFRIDATRFVSFLAVLEDEKMKHVRWGLLLILLAAGANVQSKGDEEAVRRLPQAFCDAWAKHDGHAPPKIMAEDVDCVTVAATYLPAGRISRSSIPGCSAGVLGTPILRPLQTTSRFLRPDMAMGSWELDS